MMASHLSWVVCSKYTLKSKTPIVAYGRVRELFGIYIVEEIIELVQYTRMYWQKQLDCHKNYIIGHCDAVMYHK